MPYKCTPHTQTYQRFWLTEDIDPGQADIIYTMDKDWYSSTQHLYVECIRMQIITR